MPAEPSVEDFDLPDLLDLAHALEPESGPSTWDGDRLKAEADRLLREWLHLDERVLSGKRWIAARHRLVCQILFWIDAESD